MRINLRRASGSWLLASLLLLGACGGNSGTGSTDLLALPPDIISNELPGVTGLDAIRESSVINPVPVDPTMFLSSGGTVTDQTPNLLLDSEAKTISWAMYSFPSGGKDIVSLAMSFTFPNDPGVWIGIADFATGRWAFEPMITASPAELSFSTGPGQGFVSPLGNFFFVALSYDNADVVLTDITVSTDDPPPPTFTLSGSVTESGAGALAGILIGLSPGGSTTTTSVNGDYSFTGLEAGSYTITPTDTGFTFAPLSRDANVTDADISALSFVGTPVQVLVTYVADIAPLMNGSTGEDSCIGCHGGISPKLETYTQVKNNEDKISTQVNKNSGWMPEGGPKWSQANLDLFQAWIDDGLLEN